MKREMDLVRGILLFVEENIPHGRQVEVKIEGRSEAEIAYHIALLHEAKFLEAIDTSGTGEDWIVLRLTWTGHEFLDAARNSKVWEQAKSIFREKGLGMPFEAVQAVLTKLTVQGVLAAIS